MSSIVRHYEHPRPETGVVYYLYDESDQNLCLES